VSPSTRRYHPQNEKKGEKMESILEKVKGRYERALLLGVQNVDLQRIAPIAIAVVVSGLFVFLNSDHAMAASNLASAVEGVKGEVNTVARKAVGTAATAGFGLMGAGAGNTGRMVAMTGIVGTIGYMAWPMIEQALSNYTGTR
jgi:hypothetical protein